MLISAGCQSPRWTRRAGLHLSGATGSIRDDLQDSLAKGQSSNRRHSMLKSSSVRSGQSGSGTDRLSATESGGGSVKAMPDEVGVTRHRYRAEAFPSAFGMEAVLHALRR